MTKITNDITIDIEATMNLENHSITDGETIRQIGLVGCDFSGKYDDATKDILGMKIKPMFQFAALYPHIYAPLNISPEDKSPLNEIEGMGNKMLDELYQKRKARKAKMDEEDFNGLDHMS